MRILTAAWEGVERGDSGRTEAFPKAKLRVEAASQPEPLPSQWDWISVCPTICLG